MLRRDFIRLGGLVILAGSLPLKLLASEMAGASKPAMGLQLTTIKKMLNEDFFATLDFLASLGYQELEFAGVYGQKPSEVAKSMTSLGLKAPSCLIRYVDLLNNLEEKLAVAKELGCSYIVMPHPGEEYRTANMSKYKELAEKLNISGEICKNYGIKLCYHNHDFEFSKIEGVSPYSILLDETVNDYVSMEIDLYWAKKAKVDIPALFKSNPGRFELWHIKDMSADGGFANLGQGVIKFNDIVSLKDISGMKHVFIEKDVTDDERKTLIESAAGFRKIFA